MTEQPQGAPREPQPSPITLRTSEHGAAASESFYLKIGGRPTLETLVRRFYDGVSADPVLWPMYPADDLEGAIQRLTMFFEQYWGGPGTYSEQRGHPRLRMRHAGYKINPEARDHWLQHMRAALDTLELSPLDDATFWSYLERAATTMLNTFDA